MTDRTGAAGAGSANTTGDTDAGVGAAVALDDVRKTYHLGAPVHALDGVSLTIPDGSYTAVMGPSGSGKSTLMNLVGCLDTPTEGTVEVGGEDVASLSEDGKARLRGQQVGFVFQTFNLMPRLSAAENVGLPMVFRGRSRADREDRAGDLLDQVGLGDRLDHQPSELSGGQRQRVAIARALANDPQLILADEPTGNLDTETGSEILSLFERLHAAGNTVLLVTHERRVAEHADRIVHLLDGRIDEIEPVAEPRQVTDLDGDRPGRDERTGADSTPADGSWFGDGHAENTPIGDGERAKAGVESGSGADGAGSGVDEDGIDDRTGCDDDGAR